MAVERQGAEEPVHLVVEPLIFAVEERLYRIVLLLQEEEEEQTVMKGYQAMVEV